MYDFSNAGGGGERVLWTAIRDVQREFPNVICVVYTGDLEATKEQIISKVKVVQLYQSKCEYEYLNYEYRMVST